MPGDLSVRRAKLSLSGPSIEPKWVSRVGRKHLRISSNRLHVSGLPVFDKKEVIGLVKKLYYSASGGSTPYAIHHKLQPRVANVSEASVRRIMETFETYQVTKRVLKPPDNRGHKYWWTPGTLQADTTFTDGRYDKKYAIATMHDVWSGYTRALLVENETAALTARAMKQFGQELMSKFGVRPKVLMTDKGSEYATFARLARTWGARHLPSPTGKPINEVEAKNAMVKRRLEIQLVAHGTTRNISGILGQICEDINNAPRQWREGHSPIELLTMSPAMRKEVNARSMKKRRHYSHSEAFKSYAKEVRVGTSVRRILWTTKDIKTRPMGKKGHMEKWSRTIYKVLKIITQRNAVKKYKLDDGISRLYFRTEIQKVTHVDTDVPKSAPPKQDDKSIVSDDVYQPPKNFKAPPRRASSRRAKHRLRVGQRVWFAGHGKRIDAIVEKLEPDTATVSYDWTDGKRWDEKDVARALLTPNYDDD